jgi:hypothetical protein
MSRLRSTAVSISVSRLKDVEPPSASAAYDNMEIAAEIAPAKRRSLVIGG